MSKWFCHTSTRENEMSDHRWALYIDVEGFSARWAETHVAGLGELMLAISRIGVELIQIRQNDCSHISLVTRFSL